MKKIKAIFIFLSLISMQLQAFDVQYKFEKFQLNDKLPSNSVIRTFNDSEGYMWFGTRDGLCRFDGYDIKVFRSSALTPGILNNNEIQCIAEDKKKRIWIGTFEGINIIDKRNFRITIFENEFVKKDRINAIISDHNGDIWIGTSSNGLIKVNVETDETERISSDNNSRIILRNNNIVCLYEDHQNRLWFTSWKDGMGFIDKDRTKVTYGPQIGSTNNPFRLYQEKNGDFWICTWGDGIYKMNVTDNSNINVYPLQLAGNHTSPIDKIVYSITQDDRLGLIWIVTYSGVNILQKNANGDYNILDNNLFFAYDDSKLFHEIMKDRRGNLWLGSIGEGSFKLDFNKIPIRNYPLTEVKSMINAQSYVTKLCQTNKGNMLLVINRIGIFDFNPATGKVFRPDNADLRGLNSITAILNLHNSDYLWITNEGENKIHIFKQGNNGQLQKQSEIDLSQINQSAENSISTLFQDNAGAIWIGSNVGLYQRTTAGKLKEISSKVRLVNSINEDKQKNIWIGTEKDGLYVFTPSDNNNPTDYKTEKKILKIGNFESVNIQTVCCTKNGNVYVGTKEGCIYQIKNKTAEPTDLSGAYGITDESIMDITEDASGSLWITTSKKIIRYNPQTHAAIYYSNADGIQVSSFYKGASVITKNGQIFVGGNKGICAINIANQKLTTVPSVKHVVITDLLIENKSIFIDELFENYDAKNNRLSVSYSDNNIGIEFSALDYTATSKIQYAYKLSGINNDWNYVGNDKRFVNYANLPAGTYTFMVKASDENGLWSDDITSVEVVIHPPFYRSWWAYLLYLALLGLISFISVRIIINRIRLRNELKISVIEKEKSEELAQVKLRYFTNISHELLTPLTIIMLQIENLQQKFGSDTGPFEIMKDNVIRLKRLIKQILVFRKTESGNMKLSIIKGDIVSFVKNICQSNFKPLVKEKLIDFTVDIEYDHYLAYFDPDKLDKIIYNLLSNAFKYTPQNGSIAVKMSFIPRNDITIMRLSVADNGSGIAEEDQPHVFKRFYISSTSDQSQSHGIGLALTNDLLNLHKGNIQVKSQLGEGAVFTFEIPVSENAYTEEEMSEDLQPDLHDSILSESSYNGVVRTENETEPGKLAILVVEDNRELNKLIVDHFADKYTVYSAENGIEALSIVREKEVDLVISDVMMPEMDGLTFCKILKNDLNTSHINVLMLTAKNSTEDRIDCYNAGADAYISKPFELAVLYARVKNLITRRKQKVENFQHNHEINITSMEYSSIDEIFLKQAVKKVEEKLADDTFDFDQFALDMATSKSTLHRKLKTLTGLSPGEFIRNIRLKHSVQMLTNNMGNISEIAFAVGFNDPKYFSRCFKIEFGMTPKEYQESKKKQ